MSESQEAAGYRIYDAINLLIRTLFLLGYSGFYQKTSGFVSTRAMLTYSVVMPVSVVIGFILCCYLKITHPQHVKLFQDMDKLLLSCGILEIVIAILSFCVNVYSMQTNRLRHIQMVDRIDKIDSYLVDKFRVQMCYQKYAFKTILVVAMFFVYEAVLTILFLSHWVLGDYLLVIGIMFSYSMITFGMHLGTYSYMAYTDIVRIRFRLLQKLIKPEYLREHYADSEMRVTKLRQAFKAYCDLYGVIDELNKVYGTFLFSCMSHDFVLTTIQLYLMFGRSSNMAPNVSFRIFLAVLSSLAPPAYKMIMMPIYSTMSMNEGKKFMRAIKLIDDAFPGDDRVRQIVDTALLWNNHNRIECRIGRTITSNMGWLTTATSAVVNYVVIMLQFQIQEAVFSKERDRKYFG